MSTPQEERPPIAVAYEWVSKITAIALEMVVVIVLGHWLDARLGTRFLGLLGLMLGPAIGFWHLLWMTGVVGSQTPAQDEDTVQRDQDDDS